MNNKIIIGIGAVLLLIVIVQSFFLMRMSNRMDQLSENTETRLQYPDLSGKSPLSPPSGSIISPNDKGWNPFEEMQRMQNEMNKIFGDMRSQLHLGPGFGDLRSSFSFSPSVDIKEEKEQIIVTADIPGSDESNINVTVDDRHLSISATTKKSAENKNDNRLFRSERFVGQFQRTITLPAPVLAEKMKTDYKDGVLTNTLPKA